MKYIEKTFKYIFNLFIIILSIFALILIIGMVQVNIFGKEYVNLFGYSFFKVETGSMEQTIKIGDIVIIKHDDNLQEGDIISFKQNDNIITHRIVKTDGEKIVTKGDSNNIEDEEISKNEVIGKVVGTIKNVEIWKKVITTPKVYIPAIITIVLFGISFSMKDNNKGAIK